MHPHLRLGDWALDAYTLFFVLAWVVGAWVFHGEVRRRGWPYGKLLVAMAGCVVGAVLGALVSSVLFYDWAEVGARVARLDLPGKSVVGGIFGGYAGVELAKKLVDYPHSTGDAFALAIPLGQATGRVGCFLAGCCYGTESALPWAVRFPAGSIPYRGQVARRELPFDAPASLPIHPTQLYELAFDLVLFFALYKLRDRLRIRGNLFRVYLFAYATFRFALEFVRGDSPFPAAGGPKPIQVLLVLAAARYAWVLWRQELAPVASPTRSAP